MAIDFAAIKRLPPNEQVTELRKLLDLLEKNIKDNTAVRDNKELAEEKRREAHAKTVELAKDKNTAEQLLAFAEIEAKVLEEKLQEKTAEKKEDAPKELEQILAQAPTAPRQEEPKVQTPRLEDLYKETGKPAEAKSVYESQKPYESQNRLYDEQIRENREKLDRAYANRQKERHEKGLTESIMSDMYQGSGNEYTK
ncbi:hypothetical protein C4580_02260 [Candidatus Woesearchaeota archaeon]|nr:MAG: hypothetical protein C4580_02260 [Candidatus Woesearchaeota archaeon]